MDTPLLDLGYLIESSDNDPAYITDVIGLFLESVPHRLVELDRLVRETNDYDSIQKLAHFLKSSANIIKIRDMQNTLARVELLAKEKTSQQEIKRLTEGMLANFREALPLLVSEEKRYKKSCKLLRFKY